MNLKKRPPSLAAALSNANAGAIQETPADGKTITLKENAATTDAPNSNTTSEASTAASQTNTVTTEQPSVQPILIIAVSDERIATLLGSKIRAWLLPSARDIEIRVIASTDATDEEQKIASMLASLGYDPSAIKEAFGNVKLNW